MTATEQLTTMAADFAASLAEVRAEYGAMPLLQTQLLMRRHNLSNAQDAYSAEAKARLRMNAWATATKAAA